MSDNRVAIVHDYLTQRGGAERVVISMTKAFPGAPIYTSLYEPAATYPAFQSVDVRVSGLNRLALLRNNHRLALPFLAATFSRIKPQEEVVLCSSSGWAHGARARGRKVVYAYAPARWLYQSSRYLRGKGGVARAGLEILRPLLLRWDQRAARNADVYLTSSTKMQEAILGAYGIRADLLPPPVTINQDGEQSQPRGIAPGYFLCVSRLLPYKNVDAVVAAFDVLAPERLVVVGTGPDEIQLRKIAGPNVRLIGQVSDAELRWLYAHARALVAASFEDFGLTPLEAAVFGTPSIVLRAGGFLDTVVEGETGMFFNHPSPESIAGSIRNALGVQFDRQALRDHAGSYSEANFIDRLRAIVAGRSEVETSKMPA
jgi:glycosyltransferase involved in cell wall biosynthesis